MSTMNFYGKAVALNRDQHKKLKLQLQPNHYLVAAKTNSVLLACTEFSEAARDYPIIFVGQEGGPFTAAVLVGLGDQENLLVDEEGAWEAGAYIPAFIRRYPFVLAGPQDAETLTVCVDETYAGLTVEGGEDLFDEAGAESDYLKSVVEFLRLFHAEMANTNVFAMKLAELQLLTPKVISIEHAGEKKTLDGLWVVDEEKLAALDDAQVLDLVKTRGMALVHMHLFSLKNVARLAKRADARRQRTQETPPGPSLVDA